MWEPLGGDSYRMKLYYTRGTLVIAAILMLAVAIRKRFISIDKAKLLLKYVPIEFR